MNILPKKRWHVRNKDNVARVRRDEENARLEALELTNRAEAAEKEARLNYMRKRKSSSTKHIENAQSKLSGQGRHINFFEGLEDSEEQKGAKSNKEYEAEKKAEKEKYEKSIGLLTYLGQSVVEKKGEKPWYLQNKDAHSGDIDIRTECHDSNLKGKMDPLRMVEKHLKRKKEKKKEKKMDKHSKKRKLVSEEELPKLNSLQKLREERLRREKAERERSKRLLSKDSDDKPEPREAYNPSRYSSQYHPELARQPKSWRDERL